jgi:hypothetical protein
MQPPSEHLPSLRGSEKLFVMTIVGNDAGYQIIDSILRTSRFADDPPKVDSDQHLPVA